MKQYTVTFKPYTCIFETTNGETYSDLYPGYDIEDEVSPNWTASEDLAKVLDDVRNKVIDYKGFLTGAAKTGVHHYVIDFQEYKAKYFSKNEEHSYVEPFPEFFRTL